MLAYDMSQSMNQVEVMRPCMSIMLAALLPWFVDRIRRDPNSVGRWP